MRIGIISDTHGLLRPEALAHLEGVDHIIQAGDIGSPELVPRPAEIAPVTAIRGNVDAQPWARAFPAWDVLTLAGRMIYIIHDVAHLDLNPAAAGIWCVGVRPLTRAEDRDRKWRGPPQSRQRGATPLQAPCHTRDGGLVRNTAPTGAPYARRVRPPARADCVDPIADVTGAPAHEPWQGLRGASKLTKQRAAAGNEDYESCTPKQ